MKRHATFTTQCCTLWLTVPESYSWITIESRTTGIWCALHPNMAGWVGHSNDCSFHIWIRDRPHTLFTESALSFICFFFCSSGRPILHHIWCVFSLWLNIATNYVLELMFDVAFFLFLVACVDFFCVRSQKGQKNNGICKMKRSHRQCEYRTDYRPPVFNRERWACAIW